MPPIDSALDTLALDRARRMLREPGAKERVWPAVAAAAFFAASALALATAMVMAPPLVTSHLPAERLGG